MIKRRSLTRLVALAAVLAAVLPGAGTASANGSGWSIVPSPNFGTYDILRAVAAVSSSDVWAAGYYTSGLTNQTLIEHWNGSFWQTVTSPNEGSRDNFLYGLAAVSANDVWAVGYYVDSAGFKQTLTEVWNGSSWQVGGSVGAAGAGGQEETNFFNAIATSSTGTPTAVGATGTQALIEQCCFLSSWFIVFGSVAGTSSERTAAAYDPSGDVWAVSDEVSNGAANTLVEEQTGSSLQITASPNAGSGDSLTGVAAIASNDVWAVGDYSDSSGTYTLIEHYTSGGPTMPRLAQVSVHRTNGRIEFRWRVADQTGIAGINLYAGVHRVNQQLIPVHRASAYRYEVQWTGSGPFSVRAMRAMR